MQRYVSIYAIQIFKYPAISEDRLFSVTEAGNFRLVLFCFA